ncbi:hypothetical protein CNEO3_310009 [Clostridium neonatale]|nr:hypothetical protein CNEO3_310009 [Clostridium neonatale]CAI3671474.1 hypothetical protein CNEO4_50025 [Clostridium neonatale]CAI3684297.1 hypothetical protein CNEO4_50025 [Clostridium neonatale]CAI3694188.1 hypothetical protein CNEO4_50025 [Clostridium neonatale]CAI4141133.1 hypothetical protein CNEO4_50025 [Clostridium neonatale]
MLSGYITIIHNMGIPPPKYKVLGKKRNENKYSKVNYGI